MDKIFAAILQSNQPEQEKNEIIRRIVSTGKKRQNVDLTLNMFESTTQILLTGSSGFQWDAAKQVYLTWGSNNKTVLRQYFTPDLMHSLLDEHFPNHFNAIWIMHTSIAELRESIDYYNQMCNILQQKATTFIRTHPAFSTVVPFCKMLREFREGIPRGVMTPLFCNTIIDVVSTYTIQTVRCEVFQFLHEMSTIIGDLLGHIWEKCNEETMWRSLKHMFELIREGEKEKSPSMALAAVVQHFPTHSIEQALRSLLQDPSVCSGDLRIALERMILWLQWPGAKNIHLWVNGFLQELSYAKKYSVLIEVTEGTIEKVIVSKYQIPVAGIDVYEMTPHHHHVIQHRSRLTIIAGACHRCHIGSR
jgi:ubiquitin carboxyl-terminal hydrolase 35/38